MGNYNLKNILLGIGIGLILSSMINISLDNKEMTLEEIKQEAAKHDLIVFTKDEIMNNNPLENDPVPSPTAVPTQAPAAGTTVDPSPTAKPEVSGSKVTVNVKSGMSSEEIANLLSEAGLLIDKKAFLKRLGELGLESRLKVGSFEISKGSGYDEIIKLLTR